MAENITLEQLSGQSMGGTMDSNNLQEVNLEEFTPKNYPESDATDPFIKEAYDSIAPGIERYTAEFKEQLMTLKEQQAEKGDGEEVTFNDIEKNIKASRSDSSNTEEQKEESVAETKSEVKEEELVSDPEPTEPENFDDDMIDMSSSGLDYDEDDFKDLEDAEEVNDNGFTVDEEKIYNEYKESIRKNIPIINNDDLIDLSSFSKGSEITSVRALDKTSASVRVIADHVMFTSGRCISMESLNSDEIVQFNPAIIQRMFERANFNVRRGSDRDYEDTLATINSFRQYNRLFHSIYNHVTDKTKGDFNTWLKGIKWADLEDLFFLAYKATYGSISNKVTVNCSNAECNSLFIQEANIIDMVKFGNKEAEERFKTIMQLPEGSSLEEKIIEKQVSRDYIFTFKAPSLYTMVVEAPSLSVELLNKYSNIFNIYQYIDTIEFIDREAHCRRPVKFPKYADITKTTKAKIKIIADILKTMTLDQRQAVLTSTSDLDRNTSDISYVMPETKCEKCGTVIEETPMSCADLLFTRFQLIAHLS